MKSLRWICCVISFFAWQSPAHAVVIDFLNINNAFGTLGVLGQINTRTNPYGGTMEIATGINLQTEAGAATAGDLTVTGGAGFILNFAQTVSSVRVRFSDNKDLNQRYLRSYDTNITFAAPIPPEIGLTSLTVTSPTPGAGNDFFDLTLSDPTIRAVRVTSGSAYHWAVNEIEFDFVSIREPATSALFGLGLLGLAAARRGRRPA
jgi:hypothetical protein